MNRKISGLLVAVSLSLVGMVFSQTPTTPYGMSLTLDAAKKLVSAGQAEAKKNSWDVVIVVVDVGGHAILLERMDNAQVGSVEVAKDKATAAVMFRRPTKMLQDNLAQGGEGLRILKVRGATAVEGGIPIISEGKIIGAIGVSGVTSAQDGQIAQAALDAVYAK